MRIYYINKICFHKTVFNFIRIVYNKIDRPAPALITETRFITRRIKIML